MLRLLLAVLAYVWGAFLAPDDDGDDSGNDDGSNNDNGDGDKPKSDAKWTDKDLDKYKGDARKEGRHSGEKETLGALGFESVEEAKQKLSTFQQWEEDEKTELDKAADHIEKLTKRAETAESRVSELEGVVKQRDRKDAILSALSEASYTGKTSHALGAIDASFSEKVKEEEGEFDASEAVKALSDDGFPGFEEPLNDPPTIQRQRRQKKDGDKSHAQKWAERTSKRRSG